MKSSKKDFKVLRRIGKGGFGVVYEATRRSDGTRVALKVLDRSKLEEKNLYRGVKNEVDIHRSLTNPAVVKLFDKFEDGGFIYLVLEYCPNGDLHHFLKNRSSPLPEQQVRELFKQVVEGVVYLHKNHIVHRDLSLNNLLLTQDMTLKISDFGLAKRLDGPQDRHNTICGTPNFMSPETLKKSACGFMGDCWSLGCILYYLLIGELPFEANGVEEIMGRVRSGQFHMPHSMSVDARSLITLLLQTDPSNRVRAEEILSHSFLVPSYQVLSGESADSGNATLDSEHSITSDFSKLTTSYRLPSQQRNYLGQAKPAALRPRTRPPVQPSGPLKPPGPLKPSYTATERRSKPECLNTVRLTPRVQARRGYEIEVCPNGSICLKRKAKENTENDQGRELRVSGDGLSISVLEQGHHTTLSYNTLPDRYYNDYTKLLYCVKALKSCTPKITLYTAQCTAHYMENGPDPTFEVRFTDGSKLVRTADDCIYTEGGTRYSLAHDITPGPGLPAHCVQTVAQCKALHVQCTAVEQCIEGLQCSVSFPIRMGLPPKQQQHSYISSSELSYVSHAPSTGFISHATNGYSSNPGYNGSSPGYNNGSPGYNGSPARSQPLLTTESPVTVKRSCSFNRSPLAHTQRSGSPQRRHSVDESPVQSMENKENKENKDGGYIHQEYAAGLGWLKHLADGTCSLECNDGSELRCQAGSKDILLKSDGKTQRLQADSPAHLAKTRALNRYAHHRIY